MSNSVQQMCLAQSDTTVEKQGIVRLARGFYHGEGSSVRKAITITDNKGIKGIARIEAVIHLNVGALLVFPFFCQVVSSTGIPILEILQVGLHGRFRWKIIIREIVCWIRPCGCEAAIYLSAWGSRLIMRIGNRDSDRLSGNIRQYVFNRAPPACINNVTSQGAGNLKYEIEQFVLLTQGVSIDIVDSIWPDTGQVGREQPCFRHWIDRGRFESFERSTPECCNIHCITPCA